MVRKSIQITLTHFCLRAHVRDTNRSQFAVCDSRKSASAISKNWSESRRTSTAAVFATLKSSPLVNSVWKTLACFELNDTARPVLEIIKTACGCFGLRKTRVVRAGNVINRINFAIKASENPLEIKIFQKCPLNNYMYE